MREEQWTEYSGIHVLKNQLTTVQRTNLLFLWTENDEDDHRDVRPEERTAHH